MRDTNRDKWILGDNSNCCRRNGHLIESKKPRTLKKNQTYYFREVLICSCCKRNYTHESAKVIIGSSEDLLLRPQVQTNLFN